MARYRAIKVIAEAETHVDCRGSSNRVGKQIDDNSSIAFFQLTGRSRRHK